MPLHPEYDVAVIGAGPAGLVAATQAARAGARVLLVEKSGIIGGTTVLNGVNFPGLFHAWGRQVIAGIGWELVTSVVDEDGGTLPDFSNFKNKPHHRLQILVNAATYAMLADRMVIQSGAEVLLHTMPAAVSFDGEAEAWTLTLCTKEGLESLVAKVLIDCTGDANIVGLAGLGRHRNEHLQPGTLVVEATGYDLAALDYDALEAAFLREVAEGEMLRSDFHAARNPVRIFLHARGNNAMHVPGIDAASSAGKTRAELQAREVLMRIQRFMRRQPGLAGFRISHFAAECGIRETYTIDGETCITARDYTSGRVWADSLCHSFYPIDIHSHDGVGIDIRPLIEGVFPTIPLGAMLPRTSRNLIVAGRCACGDQAASSAFRVQASCMAMGQVAGAAASLAAGHGTELREAPVADIRRLLALHGAIVPAVAGNLQAGSCNSTMPKDPAPTLAST
ncbi:MAG: FAD-dependent oxidoreductase [Opitutaceae bacterium]